VKKIVILKAALKTIKKYSMQRYIFLTFFLLPALVVQLSAQYVRAEFGKNRVQYHDDFKEWSKYESDNFITFWYGEARNVGQAAVQIAEQDFKNIQAVLEHPLNEKLQIIVYTDLTDLKQSNIGVEDAFVNTAGQTKIVGNKIFVYFNGDHTHLRSQIREGIASVYLDAMLFGSTLQEIVQNAVMMNLPDWFKQGLTSYIGEYWNTETDNLLRDALLDKSFKGFEQLAAENPRLAGHAFWYFIGENYGASTVSNLLYLTRINRSVESGFLYVLGASYSSIIDSWEVFFRRRYENELLGRVDPEGRKIAIKNKRNLPISQLRVSPDGRQIVYQTNEIGQVKVYVQALSGKSERTQIFKEGFRNAFQATDYGYPLIAWNPNGQQIAILFERRDIAKLLLYDVKTKKKTLQDLAPEYQRVHSIDFVNPVTLVFSATIRGFSDIFLYFINTRQSERLTNDIFDDLDAAFVKVNNRRGILFASNRPDSLMLQPKLDSILPVQSFDIFYYDLDERIRELVRVTNTPYANEKAPVAVDATYFAWLSDQSGIYNREAGYLETYLHHYDRYVSLNDGTEIIVNADSLLSRIDTAQIETIVMRPVYKKRAITHSNTNYTRNLIGQHTSPASMRVVELVYKDGKHQVMVSPLAADSVIQTANTTFQSVRPVAKPLFETAPEGQPSPADAVEKLLKERPPVTPDTLKLPEMKRDTDKIDIDNYLFQSEFDDEDTPPVVIKIDTEEKSEVLEDPLPAKPQRNSPKRTGTAATGATEEIHRFRPGIIIPYRLLFQADFVQTQLDNSILFGTWESHAANSRGDFQPPLGILFKANFKDLLEDYDLEGGVRIPTSFNGSEYFITFKDKKKRLDKYYTIYRSNFRETVDTISFIIPRQEVNTILGQFGVSWPLDIFRSFRATAGIRRDRVTRLSTERSTLEQASVNQQRASLRLEYVFDNTLDLGINLMRGSRYRLYAEVFKSFNLDFSDGASLNFGKGIMTILGLDARHYHRLDKYSIVAMRVAGATSFGAEKISYQMGGVENSLFSTQFNEEIPRLEGNLAFNALAAQMRGFARNIRNGNSYALINTELRVPVFRYLSKNIRSAFFRNFQVVGFFDAGTAWSGSNPFSKDNPLNISTFPTDIRDPLVSVRVKYFRDPIVAGYGVGLRCLVFGYFLKLDYGWGIETRDVQEPRLHFSLGTDF